MWHFYILIHIHISQICFAHFREYLTGFRKRKDERRRIAAENLLKEMKEEKKRLKQQV